MRLRQEYKPEKQRFENPFEVEVDRSSNADRSGEGDNGLCNGISLIKLRQSYTALGTTVWDGSIALAKMFDNRDLFPLHYLQECRVLELGAGCGLVGIYLCLLGAKMTVLTDQKCCVKTLKDNVAANVTGVGRSRIKVVEYCWGKSTEDLTKDGLFHLILAAECQSLGGRLCASRSVHDKISKTWFTYFRINGKESWRRGNICENDGRSRL